MKRDKNSLFIFFLSVNRVYALIKFNCSSIPYTLPPVGEEPLTCEQYHTSVRPGVLKLCDELSEYVTI